jgi:methylthioribose-1-phosphate isomerase
MLKPAIPTMEWTDGGIRIIDQTRLPAEEVYITLRTIDEVCEAIKALRVRGAPALGVVGAMGLALAGVVALRDGSPLDAAIRTEGERLRATRPTAVNLGWALDRALRNWDATEGEPPGARVAALIDEARVIHEEDLRMSRDMARAGAALLPRGARVLTHCNTGALATGGLGTALGVVIEAHAQGREPVVYADETRPLLQGARLTAWELKRLGIPVTVLVDGAAPALMRSGRIDMVLYGADRVAANGDTANKIGSYMLSLAAKAHGIPLYVVAPTSSFDLSIPDGDAIPIEERSADEVGRWGGRATAPEGVAVYNPAFDVTPAAHVTGWITERGVLVPPFPAAPS